MKNIYILGLVLLFCSAKNYADFNANFNAGVYAYIANDYELAFTTMQSLGETADHSLAQLYLGMMYLQGKGVEKNYKNAATWFRKAAEKGVTQAQHKLGKLYMHGYGVPKDYELAYAWFSVGVDQQHTASIEALEEITLSLSETELAEAKKLAATFIAKYSKAKKIDKSSPIQIN